MEKELKVREIIYNLLDCLVMMYTEIEDLEQLGVTANNLYLVAQLITFALNILKNTRDSENFDALQDSLWGWARKFTKSMQYYCA